MSKKSEAKGARKARPEEKRGHAPDRKVAPSSRGDEFVPAAGAHAAAHLVNEDATPGAGALPNHAHRSGREVDGAAG